MKKIIPCIVAIGAAGTILGACGSGEQFTATQEATTITQETTTASTETTISTTEEAQTASSASPGESGIGTVYSFTSGTDEWDMTINSVDYVDELDTELMGSISQITPDQGMRFCVLNATLKNNGKEAQTMDSIPDMEFSKALIYDNDYIFQQFQTYEENENGVIQYDSMGIYVQALSEKKGKFVFQVPKEVTETNKPLVFKGDNPMNKQTFFEIKVR